MCDFELYHVIKKKQPVPKIVRNVRRQRQTLGRCCRAR